jgi:hypothetical protein
MKWPTWSIGVLILVSLRAQTPNDYSASASDSAYNVKPPVAQVDLRIARRAMEILNSPAKWNRGDSRVCRIKQCKSGCPTKAQVFSLYCALEKATNELTGSFEHRGTAMQEARFVVDEVATNRSDFQHRLQGYNNDPATTFADIQRVLQLVQSRIGKQLDDAGRLSQH